MAVAVAVALALAVGARLSVIPGPRARRTMKGAGGFLGGTATPRTRGAPKIRRAYRTARGKCPTGAAAAEEREIERKRERERERERERKN